MNTKQQIHTIPFEPDLTEMSSVMNRAGFKRLRDATSDSLPVGSAIIIYNSDRNSISPILIVNHYGDNDAFSFINFNLKSHLNDPEQLDPEYDITYKEWHNIKYYEYYKLLFTVPVTDSSLQLDTIPQLFEEVGFKPLNKATSEDLPQGCVALLYNIKEDTLTPVISRVLSMENHRFLHLKQSHIDGHWESRVIMEGITLPLENYLFKVIS